jgi:S-DNA-T family DNA segregation ATPase FtsK/SpoIIIE
VEPCAECGYDYGAAPRAELAGAIGERARSYRLVLLDTDDAAIRAHALPGVWSILEYGCHVRDLLTVQRERVERALGEDRPDFASMRREERVLEEGYNTQAPSAVAQELEDAADALAGVLDRLDDTGWERTGIYHWPTTQLRSVEWIGRHTLHECVHHLGDISRYDEDEIAALRGQGTLGG